MPFTPVKIIKAPGLNRQSLMLAEEWQAVAHQLPFHGENKHLISLPAKRRKKKQQASNLVFSELSVRPSSCRRSQVFFSSTGTIKSQTRSWTGLQLKLMKLSTIHTTKLQVSYMTVENPLILQFGFLCPLIYSSRKICHNFLLTARN